MSAYTPRGLLAVVFGVWVFGTTHAVARPDTKADYTQYTKAKATLEKVAKRVNWRKIELNRTAKKASSVGSISKLHLGFKWDKGDGETHDWFPQGIAGLPGKKLAVSWYSKHGTKGFDNYPTSTSVRAARNRGVRISIVDVSNTNRVKYRHVLLVVAASKGADFRAVECHAGGIAVLNGLLYVADTNQGLRVFDLDDMYEVATDKGKGVIGRRGLKAYAHNYRYALLQKAFIRLNGPKFSYLAIDWTWRPDSKEPLLVTGNYHSGKAGGKYYNPPSAMVWWQPTRTGLGMKKILDTRDSAGVKYLSKAQGGVARDGVVWISQGGDPGRLRVARFPPTKSGNFKKYSWIKGTEDLHYSRSSGNLWSLSEWPGTRYFFAVKAKDYGP